MEFEGPADNVWAEAGHASPDENITTQGPPIQDDFDEASYYIADQTVQAEVMAGDGQRLEKIHSSSKVGKARKAMAVKAYRARYALIVMFGYICSMVLAFLIIDSAAIAVRGVVMPLHRMTTHQVDNIMSQEISLMRMRNKLAEIRLHKRPFETHPGCLTRATNVAHDHYSNLPYQSFPDVIRYTVEWVQAECDRIIFSPVPVPSSGWDKLWKVFTGHAEAALHHCRDVVGGFLKVKSRHTQRIYRNTKASPFPLLRGYRLGCNDVQSFCTLSFETATNLSDEVVKLIEKGRSIRQIVGTCKTVHAWAKTARQWIPWMNLLGVVLAMIAFDTMIVIEKVPKRTALWRIASACASYFMLEFVFLSLYFRHQMIAEKDCFRHEITTATYALHITVVFLCFVGLVSTWLRRSTFGTLVGALRELRIIYFEDSYQDYGEAETEKEDKSKTEQHGESVEEPDVEASDEQAAGEVHDQDDNLETASDTLSSLALHISPGSPLHEDVRRMREYLHRKQAMPKNGPQGLHLNDATRTVSEDNDLSTSPNSDAGWTVITPTESEVLAALPKEEPHDDDIVGGTTEAPAKCQQEHPAKDITEDENEKSSLCKCSVCGGEGEKAALLRCANLYCPLAWVHSECAGIKKENDKIATMADATWLCPMCG